MKKIVLIEDNQDVRETTLEILELADYEVATASNGKEGVELAKQLKPDLVICDIMMPNLDGYGVLNILSKNPDTYHIPFIFLTAKAEKEDFRKGMNLGADDYITKPFEETAFIEAIESRLKRSESLKKTYGSSIDGLNQFIDEARGIDELKSLSKNRKVNRYKKREIIYREDDYANYLYLIIDGAVKCIKTDDYGKNLVNEIYGPGDFIGYVTLLDGLDYNETAIAIEPTKLAVVPKHDFIALVRKSRDVAAKFIKMLSGNVREREKRMLLLAYASVRERLAQMLIKLTGQETDSSSPSLTLKISREDLACMVGTAKESLIRTLSELKKEGLVDTNGQEIHILNTTGLQKAATGF